jgi:hypothetical protein
MSETTQDTQDQRMPTPDPALSQLDGFVGTWSMEGRLEGQKEAPSTDAPPTSRCPTPGSSTATSCASQCPTTRSTRCSTAGSARAGTASRVPGPPTRAQFRRPTFPTHRRQPDRLIRGAGPRVKSSFPAPRGGARLAQMPDIATLPPDLSRFIGRARELREIAVLVAPGRLVTLLGPGGCGKTRLAAPAVIERWRAGRKEGS